MSTQTTNDIPSPRRPAGDAGLLRDTCGGAVHLPGDPGYDAARQPWNVAVDQRPAAVAYPADAHEVAEVVRAAAAAGLRIAPQGTGHNARPLGALDDVVLLRTSGLTGVTIDPVARRATVGSGVLWLDVVEAAAAHGLAALHGSSPDVGVAGYSLGGGIGWYARQHGMQANSLTAVELVTADGAIRRVDNDNDPELFWGLRGGGGNFGVVTALEFELYPIETVYAGALVWDWTHAERVLRRWAEWTATAPDAVTTAYRILQLPPIEAVPPPLRGRQVVMIDGAVLADDAEAAAMIAPLRELEPEMDTFWRMPAPALVRLHGDPEGPTPSIGSSTLLGSLPDDAAAAFVAAAGPGSGSTLLVAELRQLGGALGRPALDAGCLPAVDAAFVVFTVAMAVHPEAAAVGLRDARALVAAMSPWTNGRSYLNFAEDAVDTRTAYADDVYARLQALRAAVDPAGLFVANHAVPAATARPA
ncbi:MAG TPA: FAD-binding protein [Mycobacteriales bacterium]|nr:FAD-binding protein [Mycobacteriales bacterium]